MDASLALLHPYNCPNANEKSTEENGWINHNNPPRVEFIATTNTKHKSCSYVGGCTVALLYNVITCRWSCISWWRHQMETSSHFTNLLCGEFSGHRWIPRSRASDAELWCFLLSTPEQQLSKQWRRRWFETQSPSLWRHCNDDKRNNSMCNSSLLLLLCYAETAT